MAVTHLVLFTALFATVIADYTVAKIQPCSAELPENCTVTEVRIDPCRTNGVCVFKRGRNASLSFDFTPSFTASKLKTAVFWASNAGDLAFAGMNTDDACELTTCPTVPGTSQTLNYNLYIGKLLPAGSYTIKWKVWDEQDNTQTCCYLTKIEIKKK